MAQQNEYMKRQDLYDFIESTIKDDTLSEEKKCENINLFIDLYVGNVFYKNIAVILKLLYDGDTTELKKDLITVRLAGAGNEKSRNI